MQRTLLLILALCAALSVRGAWYWPFGSDEDDPSKPLRLHRLLEDANNYIEVAEEEAMNGNADKALENYRLALSELDRVERENPDRAETPEFSPLRNKRASCVAAMDAIRFAQVDENERAVSVTDTRELQKKWNRKHGIKEPEEEKAEPVKKPKAEEPAKAVEPAKNEKQKTEEPPKQAEEPPKQAEEPPKQVEEPAKQAEEPPKQVEEPPKQAEEPPKKAAEEPVVEKQTPKAEEKPKAQNPSPEAVEKPKAEKPAVAAPDFKARFKIALAEVRNRDYAAADLMLESLLKERPNDLNTLLLRAAAQAGLESNYAARRTLEKAMRAHPKSYLPYYNLAHLVLKLGEGTESARQYYEMGRAVGGPVSSALEAQLKK